MGKLASRQDEKTRGADHGKPTDMYRKAICWLRRDLRLDDNTALKLACDLAEEVLVVFVFDTAILNALDDKRDTRVTFIHQSISELSDTLLDLGSRLFVLTGDPIHEIPRLASEWGAECVFAAHDDDPYAIARDNAVRIQLRDSGRAFQTAKDHVVFEKQEILNQSGQPFRVFTPFSKAWASKLTLADFEVRNADFNHLVRKDFPLPNHQVPTHGDLGFQWAEPWIPGGRKAALERLRDFESKVEEYAEVRDFPTPLKTSKLSADLRFGTISVRECVRFAHERTGSGSTKWLAEIVWREFYHMILANFPEVVSEPMNPHFKGVKWPGKAEHYSAWEVGQTGYPLVDASLRCLNSTGWLQNRLRMVVAMFFTKDLLLDYRLGEAWFARKLLDFELASNNGGWQWSASTGADAQPWFRIFNPVTQSIKFDPNGEFIREWCPELSGLSNEFIHWPVSATDFDRSASGVELGLNYPYPIVDHRVQRDIALAFLENTTKNKNLG